MRYIPQVTPYCCRRRCCCCCWLQEGTRTKNKQPAFFAIADMFKVRVFTPMYRIITFVVDSNCCCSLLWYQIRRLWKRVLYYGTKSRIIYAVTLRTLFVAALIRNRDNLMSWLYFKALEKFLYPSLGSSIQRIGGFSLYYMLRVIFRI